VTTDRLGGFSSGEGDHGKHSFIISLCCCPPGTGHLILSISPRKTLKVTFTSQVHKNSSKLEHNWTQLTTQLLHPQNSPLRQKGWLLQNELVLTISLEKSYFVSMS
jgi:hypothetical protein